MRAVLPAFLLAAHTNASSPATTNLDGAALLPVVGGRDALTLLGANQHVLAKFNRSQ